MKTRTKSSQKTWKEKAIERGKLNRRYRSEIKRQKKRAKKWRQLYFAIKSFKTLTPMKYHSYPLELIWLGILMNINFNISLRGTAKSITKIGELFGFSIDKLSATTVRNWSLKLGLYFLLESIPKGKYVLILDESVEINREHLMVLLVVPINAYSRTAPLSFEDVRVLDLGVKQSWKSQDVKAMLDKQVKAHDLEIAYAISDKDHVLKKVLKESGIAWIGDCTHEMANISKALFKKDEPFNSFIKSMNLLRAKWIMSKYNRYIPPTLRSKNRFHQLFAVHKWAAWVLEEWNSIPPLAQKELGFVKEAKVLLKIIRELDELIVVFSRIFKAKGIQANSRQEWTKEVNDYKKQGALSLKAEEFVQKMNAYLDKQQANLKQQDQLLCCSDIIESLFGKYKNKGGPKIITDDVLKIAAYTQMPTLEQVKKAMEQIKMVDIINWKKQNTTVSKLAFLKQKAKKSAA